MEFRSHETSNDRLHLEIGSNRHETWTKTRFRRSPTFHFSTNKKMFVNLYSIFRNVYRSTTLRKRSGMLWNDLQTVRDVWKCLKNVRKCSKIIRKRWKIIRKRSEIVQTRDDQFCWVASRLRGCGGFAAATAASRLRRRLRGCGGGFAAAAAASHSVRAK